MSEKIIINMTKDAAKSVKVLKGEIKSAEEAIANLDKWQASSELGLDRPFQLANHGGCEYN